VRFDALLDAGAVAELLGVPERWVRDHTRSGEIPHVELGRYRRYVRADVLAWLEGLKRGGERADWRRIRPRQYSKAVPNGR
jgi:excisionase family DNA binding protein